MESVCISLLVIAIIIICAYRRKKTINEYLAAKPDLDYFFEDFTAIKSAYISHSMCEKFLREKRTCYDKAKRLSSSSFLPAEAKKTLSTVIEIYTTFRDRRAEWNKDFVEKERIECKSLLSNISGHSLDEQQQRAVVVDEECNLVVAGAGSGKTLTITGKVKYLCQRKNIHPSDLLLIAFTRKAASEMTVRLKAMGITLEANTFHKIGLDIISRSKGYRPEVLDEGEFKLFLDTFFGEKIWRNTTSVKALVEYFAFYLRVPTDMSKAKSIGEAYEHERNVDLETLRSKYFSSVAAADISEKKHCKGSMLKVFRK